MAAAQGSEPAGEQKQLTATEIDALTNGRGSCDLDTVDGISEKIYHQSQEVWALCDLLSVRVLEGDVFTTKLPEWALKAIFSKLMGYMVSDLQKSDGKGPTSPKHLEMKANRKHAARYMQVRYLHNNGHTLEKAYERVAETSGESPLEKAPVSDSTIKYSYQLVNKDIKNGGTKYYAPVTDSVRLFLLAHLKQ